MGIVKADACKCERCAHVWIPRAGLDALPLRCASCKSPYWNTPKGAHSTGTPEKRTKGDIKHLIRPEQSTKVVDTDSEHKKVEKAKAASAAPVVSKSSPVARCPRTSKPIYAAADTSLLCPCSNCKYLREHRSPPAASSTPA